MDHDRLFKQLLTTFFIDFVDLFLPEVRGYLSSDKIEFLDKEVFTDLTGGDRHEVDIIAKAKFKDQEAFFLIHVEDQAKAEGRFPRRMFHYFARLDERFDLPIYPVAVFSYDSPLRPEEGQYLVAFPDRKVLDFNFRVIQLNRLNWQDFAEKENPVASALMSKMRIRAEDRARAKLACMRMMLKLPLDPAQKALISEFVNQYLRLNETQRRDYEREAIELKPAEKEQVMAIMNEWTEEAIEKGLMRERALVVRMLKRKLGQLPLDIENQVMSLPAEPVEDLGEALLSMSSIADLQAWFSQRPA